MVLAEAHLAPGQHHAGAHHAADLADLERDAGTWDEAAGRREHDLQAGAGVGRAADHGDWPVTSIDRAGAQAVGVRMLHRFDHMGDSKGAERLARVGDGLQFETDAGQPVGDLVQRGVGVEMGAQPGESEFHQPSPSCSSAGDSALKPKCRSQRRSLS